MLCFRETGTEARDQNDRRGEQDHAEFM